MNPTQSIRGIRRAARFVACAAALWAVAPTGHADRGERECRSREARNGDREVVLLVADEGRALEAARAAMQSEFGVREETFRRRVARSGGGSASTAFVAVWRLGSETLPRDGEKLSKVLRRVRDRASCIDASVNAYRRARGAPTQIPVLDGDLEPRSVNEQPALAQTALLAAHGTGTGAGRVVAVLDGGFDLSHPFLAGKIHAGKWDAVDGDSDPQDLGNDTDDDGDGTTDGIVGHGTFVASVVLAGAPGATILPIRVLDDEGWGGQVAVAAGIERAVQQGAHVINLSLVVPQASEAVRSAVAAALDAGVSVVVSAGNDPEWAFDARLAQRITVVGAVDEDDVLAPFSVTGASVGVYAPGVDVIGALGGDVPGSYARWSGTSFAAPFASAALAIGRQVSPGTNVRDLRRHLEDGVDPAFGVTPANRGRIDAVDFLERVLD